MVVIMSSQIHISFAFIEILENTPPAPSIQIEFKEIYFFQTNPPLVYLQTIRLSTDNLSENQMYIKVTLVWDNNKEDSPSFEFILERSFYPRLMDELETCTEWCLTLTENQETHLIRINKNDGKILEIIENPFISKHHLTH